MKFHIEVEMTPDEARKVMGLPDVTKLNEKMLAEMEKRMKQAMDTSDPEAMLRAWMPMSGLGSGVQGFEQFQKFLWDSARKATGMSGGMGADSGPAKKDSPKSGK
ncbi:MAG TPA: DUF6489 family protein [Rhizomicrobium sp.]|jgi:hypothetical protein|nr:DUF6489 family protein [Rhizomicrobium sp.]